MADYTASTYGDRIADTDEVRTVGLPDVGPMVASLAELAGGGRALELGIGTGRVALHPAEVLHKAL